MSTQTLTQLMEIASRIKEMREIMGYSVEIMAQKTEVSVEEYISYESGNADIPFTFIHKCALAFGIELTELLEGQGARLSSYTVTRRGKGQTTAEEEGITIQNLAPMFKNKLGEPYWVKYEYSEKQQHEPIQLKRHNGQEFDLIIKGSLLVQVGTHKEVLHEGDSIFYNSSTPHGMIAIDGDDCLFCAVGFAAEGESETENKDSFVSAHAESRKLISDKFITTVEDENGLLKKIDFKNEDKYNFAFDTVDAIAKKSPDKLAMLHIDKNKVERRFTFRDMKRYSNQCVNYFKALGIK